MCGQAADYDHWRQLGLSGWGWDDVRQSFRRLAITFSATASIMASAAAGGSRCRGCHGKFHAVGEAAREMGISQRPDFNTGDNEGFGYFHAQPEARSALVVGTRLSQTCASPAEPAAVDECAGRKTCRRTGARDRHRFQQGNELVEARARGEVILAAGSIGSTQILHRSGIGPHEWLAPLGIDVVRDRQGVGRNLQDHLQQRAIFKVSGVRTLNETYHSLMRRGLPGSTIFSAGADR